MASGFPTTASATTAGFLRPHFKLVKWLEALNYLQATSSVEKGVGNCGKAGVSIYILWGSLASSLVIILTLVSCVVISY